MGQVAVARIDVVASTSVCVGGPGPVHMYLKEKDNMEDQDHQDVCIQALHLWILLTTYAVILRQIQVQKNSSALRKIG